MKTKKLTALLLAVLLVVPMILSSCNNVSDNNETNAANTSSIRQNVALNMYIITEDDTTVEQAKAVQMAINEITVPEYKTTIKINFVKEDKYWDELEKQMQKVKNYKEGVTETEETAKSQEEVDAELDELIDEIFEAEDIELDRPQLDIFLVNDYNKYKELAENGDLAPLDSYMELEEKIVKSYISPTLLKGATLNLGSTYGIPVNRPVGQYEYFVFNKEYLDKYGFSASDFKTFEDLAPYLAVIKANEPGIIPLAKTTSPAGFDFLGADGNALGTEKRDGDAFPDYGLFSIFEDKYFMKHFDTIRSYYLNGYYPGSDYNGTDFAVDIRRGSAKDIQKWEEQDGKEYEVAVYKNPRATQEELLDSVFVVSSLSSYPARAMEVLTLLTTNAEIVNLLRFGIEGTHYFKNTVTKEITMMEDAAHYKMDPKYCGNNLLFYKEYGKDDTFEADKQHNLNLEADSFLFFDPEISEKEQLVIDTANEITQRYYPVLLSGTVDPTSTFAAIKTALADLPVLDQFAVIDEQERIKAEEEGLEYVAPAELLFVKLSTYIESYTDSVSGQYKSHASAMNTLLPKLAEDPEASLLKDEDELIEEEGRALEEVTDALDEAVETEEELEEIAE